MILQLRSSESIGELIIHLLDQDKGRGINFFETPFDNTNEVQEFITTFINKENLTHTITLFMQLILLV